MHESWFVANLGWLARAQGQWDLAVERGRRAVALAAPLAHHWFVPVAEALLGSTLLEIGEVGAASRLLTEARSRAGHNGAEAHLLRCLAPLAEASGSASTLAEADALLRGISVPAGAAWFMGQDTYLSVARAWLAHGSPARAREVLRPLLIASARRWIPMEAQARLVDGQAAAALGERAAASASFRRAAELAAAHGMRGIENAALASA
jgi:Tfp pilus assembly protein PilF